MGTVRSFQPAVGAGDWWPRPVAGTLLEIVQVKRARVLTDNSSRPIAVGAGPCESYIRFLKRLTLARAYGQPASAAQEGSPFSDEWPNPNITLTLTGTLTLTLTLTPTPTLFHVLTFQSLGGAHLKMVVITSWTSWYKKTWFKWWSDVARLN